MKGGSIIWEQIFLKVREKINYLVVKVGMETIFKKKIHYWSFYEHVEGRHKIIFWNDFNIRIPTLNSEGRL